MFQAKLVGAQVYERAVSKVVCVGRNYAEHAKELNNPVPDAPILFIKPETSIVDLHEPIVIPEKDCHYETEIAVLIGRELTCADEAQVASSIEGIGLALDLTRRELQSSLKEKSHPWEIAKGFDGACPLSRFVPIEQIEELQNIRFTLHINGSLKQDGHASDMLKPIVPLIAHISQTFTLRPGDVVLTGTPKGVGQLAIGDKLKFSLNDSLAFETVTLAKV